MRGSRPGARVCLGDLVGLLIDVSFGTVGVRTHGRGLHEEATRRRLVARGVIAVRV